MVCLSRDGEGVDDSDLRSTGLVLVESHGSRRILFSGGFSSERRFSVEVSLDDLTCWKADFTETVSSELCTACSSVSLVSSLVTVDTGDDLLNGNRYLVESASNGWKPGDVVLEAIGGGGGNGKRSSCRL